ncbi:MAG TPA: hypothetical protein VGG38_07415 [Acidimicrobiales bacterium]
MALVAATAVHSNGSGRRPPASRPEAAGSTTTLAAAGPGATSGSTTTVVTPTTEAAGDPTGSDHSSQNVSAVLGPATSTTPPHVESTSTTTTTSSPAPTGSSYQGVLQPPADATAQYGFTGAGSSRVTASWSDSTYMTLSVACSGFSQSTGGSSAAAISVPDAQGDCQATLSDPSSTADTIDYTIEVSPNG